MSRTVKLCVCMCVYVCVCVYVCMCVCVCVCSTKVITGHLSLEQRRKESERGVSEQEVPSGDVDKSSKTDGSYSYTTLWHQKLLYTLNEWILWYVK